MTAIALSVTEAASAVGVSANTIRRAIKATEPDAFPPPLRAKKDSKGRYLIKVSELERWFDSLPEA